ncbi:MAG: hypothetical protein R3C59_04995 [Planctomycetaceae bacterium]
MMSLLSSKRPVLLAACLLLGTAWPAAAQDGNNASVSTASVGQQIERLAAPGFADRQKATAELLKMGDSAIEPLQQALTGASPEQRLRIQAILKSLEQNSFTGRLEKLKKQPTVEVAEGLPEWDRFSTIVGTDKQSLTFYVRLLTAEPELFAIAIRDPKLLGNALERRSAELLLAARQSAIPSEKFSADSYLALLLLAGNNDRRLPGGTSSNLSDLLESPTFVTALNEDYGSLSLKLVGAYLLRDRIAVVKPLQFAKRYPIPEGPVLARRVLQSTVRGHDGLWAMILILDQGDNNDIRLVEALFDNHGTLFNAPPPRTYKAMNSDMALAVAIAMRRQDPRDFGFGKAEPHDGKFRFALDTIGFESDEERQQAHQKYADLFLKPVEQK